MTQEIFVVGCSWRTAPVAIREQLAFTDEELPAALHDLLAAEGMAETALLSTCNRVELYATANSPEQLTSVAACARAYFARSKRVSAETLGDALYDYAGDDAVRHIFRVASALDSLVIGEAQILGQLKGAFGVATREGCTGQVLTRCFEHAFKVAKRVRSDTGIARGSANVSSVAVELAKRVFSTLQGRTIGVIGAGKMSALAARHLRADGAGTIVVTNRSLAKAEALAAEVDGVVRDFAELEHMMATCDVIISSTGSREPILTVPVLRRVMKQRRYAPLVLIDIAVPRDVAPDVAKVDGVYLFDIDDLQSVVASNLKERAREAVAAERIVDLEVTAFRGWLRTQRIVPTIRMLRSHFEQIAEAEVNALLTKMSAAQSPEDKAIVARRLAHNIVGKLLHTPIAALRRDVDIEALASAAETLFDLTAKEQSAPASAKPVGIKETS